MSIRYGGGHANRYVQPTIQGLGNRERNVLPADVWITGNNFNRTALYRQPIAIANPTWRIANVTERDVQDVKKLQARMRRARAR